MAKPLRFFNLLLGLVVLFLAGALANSMLDLRLWFFEPQALTLERRASSGARRVASQRSEAEASPAGLKSALPPLAEFDDIVAKDPFKNPFKGQEAGAPAAPSSPQAAPVPLPALLGTVFVGDEKQAILKDGGRADAYTVGQSVGGGTLVEIKEDRVVIDRAGSPVEVFLKAAIEEVRPPGKAGAPPGGAAGNAGARGARPPVVPRTQPSSAAPQESAARLQQIRAERQRLREQMRRERTQEASQEHAESTGTGDAAE